MNRLALFFSILALLFVIVLPIIEDNIEKKGIVPEKPFVVISKKKKGIDMKYVVKDKNGYFFSFDNEWLKEIKDFCYYPGDTIR